MKFHPTKKNILRVAEYLLTIWVIVTVNFLLPRVMPGDPFLYISAEEGQDTAMFSEKQREYYRDFYGLDRPVVDQYLSYIGEVCTGNLGHSIYYGSSVRKLILRRLPWTLFLVLSAIALSSAGGLALGGFSATHRASWVDKFLFLLHVVLSSVPAFLIGLILLFVFAAGLRWFPLSGAITPFPAQQSFWQRLIDILQHGVLPIAALALARTAHMYLLSRGTVIGVLEKAYIRTARAKGLSKLRILLNHILRNAFPPVCTRIFMSLGTLVGGAILVENIFAYPGLGRLMRDAVLVHDYPLIQGIFLVVTILVLGANWAADWIQPKLDPRLAESTGN